MTIHAAKGLEFDVVVVADTGRRGNLSTPDLLVDGDRVGLRLALLDGRSATPSLAFDELKDRRQLAEAQEEERVFYVALTRARERLIVSGAADASRWPREAPGAAPLSWLGPALVPDVAERFANATGESAITTLPAGEDSSLRLVLNTPATVGVALREEFRAPGAIAEVEGATARPLAAPAGEAPAPSPAVAAGPLSYTALTAYARCGYRFYAQRVLGLPDAPPPGAPAAAPAPRRAGLDARERGVLTHALIEELDFARGTVPAPERTTALAARLGLAATERDVEQARALATAFAASELAQRLAAARRVRREHEFAFELALTDAPPAMLTGVLDLLAVEPGGAWPVVDAKTDAVRAGDDLAVLVARDYGMQRDLYALAALRAGAPRVEVVYAYLARPEEPVGATFTQDDVAALTARIASPVAGIAHARFAPTEHPHADLCATCPARERLCPHPRELKLRRRRIDD